MDTLNNTCRDDETIDCSANGDADCAVANGGPGGPCGFAGFRDWCIPNVRKLQSIVDYSTSDPASSVPGLTAESGYWSATGPSTAAWDVDFEGGDVLLVRKSGDFMIGDIHARAVRPCE